MLLRYLLLWFALAVIAVANGTLRQSTYGKRLPELAAHQLSTVTGTLFTGIFVWFVHQYWPIESAAQAWLIGLSWLVFTIIFEFGFGHYVVGHPWSHLLNDYNIFKGRVWSLFLIWVLIMPYMVYKLG